METQRVPHGERPAADAAAMLSEVGATRARVAESARYPAWFWAGSGLALAALPVSTTFSGGTADLVLGVAVALLLAVSVTALRVRGVHERCSSLSAGEWLREVAWFVPAVVLLLVASAVGDAGPRWGALVAAGVFFLGWLGTGLVHRPVRPAGR